MAKNATKAAEEEERRANLTADQLKKICTDIENAAQRKTDGQAEVARLYKDAEGVYGVHRQALKACIGLSRMSDEKRADHLRAFDQYRDFLGLDEYDQADMLDAAE